LPAQATLLRVVQEREVLPVGATKPVAVDVRFVCASHKDLAALVEKNAFRADLLARLLGRRIDLPPLRDRTEDLGLLVAAILRRLRPDFPGDAMPPIQPAAARALLLHDWPANVRELEQALTAACVLAGRGPIELRHLPPDLQAPRARPTAEADTEEQKALRVELERLLAEHKGNISAIARAMGKRRQQIQRWMRRLGMPPGR
jgi:transcriptional regulator of acetoin/glycerol metabolism